MLTVDSIKKTYEGQPLLRGVSFTVGEGETLCLLGPSGSGKSTLLRIIAGLEQAEGGRVLWQGQDLSGVPVHLRQFGLMFQDYALFPHRTVAQNVAFGLRMQRLPGAEVEQRMAQALEQVNLGGFASRRVTDLSGGEQQRVALARALAPRPRLLMLDEPLGALDRALREQLVNELRDLLHRTGIPAIYVTHDQEEAFAISDRMLLLHDGIVQQEGTPAHLYQHPATAWVARFLGLTNLITGEVVGLNPVRVRTSLGVWQVSAESDSIIVGTQTEVLVRSSGASLTLRQGWNKLAGRVVDSVFAGQKFRVDLQVGEAQRLRFYLEKAIRVGEDLEVWVDPGEMACLVERDAHG